MILLCPASANEIRDNWPFFVTAVGEVIDRCGLDYHPADVYREVTSGKGPVLFWVEQEGETIGLVVAQTYVENYSLKKVLSLDLVYLHPNVGDAQEVRDAIDLLAEEHEIDSIRWMSPRKGWQRAMTRIGYTSDAMIYSREVAYGR